MKNKKPNTYYIGAKQSDIAASFDYETDKFFKGSITIYGDGSGGNRSYCVQNNVQLNIEDAKLFSRNEKIYEKYIAEQCNKIIASDPTAVFMPYSTQYAVKVPAEHQSRVICANDPQVLAFLNSKFNFKRLMNGRVPQANFEFMTGAEILHLIKKGKIPNEREVVVQSEFGAGGKGTYILTQHGMNEKSISQINPGENYVVSDYIKNLCSASFRILVSSNEVALYPPSIQTMKGPTFIGSDPFQFSVLDKKFGGQLTKEIQGIAQTIGGMYREIDKYIDLRDVGNKNLRGCFGIDLLIAENGPPYVHVIETNPRFTGASGLDNILSHEAGSGSLFEQVYQCFRSERTDFKDKVAKVLPLGESIYAEEGQTNDKYQEGYDKIPDDRKEAGAYTYRRYIQKHVEDYNTFEDERILYKEFMGDKYSPTKLKIIDFVKKFKLGVGRFTKKHSNQKHDDSIDNSNGE